jgi:hypothetical protein
MRRRDWIDLTVVAAIATLTNFTYFFLCGADFFFPDSFTYLAPAQNLLRGLGFFGEPGVVETMRTPGYPLLLALFGTHPLPVIVLQHLLNVALVGGVYLITRRRVSRSAALVAAVLLAIDTPTIHVANKILSETLFTAVLFVVFLVALDARHVITTGALTGTLVLIRPVAIAYFAVLAAYFVWRRLRPNQIAAFVCVSLVLPLGWALRNAYHTGVFTVASVSGASLLDHRAAGVLAILDGGNFDDALLRRRAELQAQANAAVVEAEDVEDAAEVDHAVMARHYARMAWPILLRHPIALAELTVRGVMINLFDSRWDALAIISRLPARWVRAAVVTLTVALFVLFVFGMIILWRRDRALALLIGGTVGYFILISAGGESEWRFRVPVMPEYVIAAGAAISGRRPSECGALPPP